MGKREEPPPFPVDFDGLPSDPSHPWNISPEEWRERLFARRLAACRQAYKAGNVVALLDIVETCSEFDRPLPVWAAEAVTAKLRLAFKISRGKRGRAPTDIAVYRRRQIDFERWDVVRELRDRKDELQELATKWTDNAVFKTASKALERTPAFGSPAAMRKSYLKVKQSTASGSPTAVRKSYLKVQKEIKRGRGAAFYTSRSRTD
jgi:hypothetical protein